MSLVLAKSRAKLLLVAFSAVVFVSALAEPEYNWDILGYVGSAHAIGESDSAVIHARVFEGLEEAVGEKRAGRLAGVDPARMEAAYRKKMAEDPDAFAYQLRYYQIRPVYNRIVYLLTQVGLDPFFATSLVSAVSVCLGLVILVAPFLGDRVDARWFLLFLAATWASNIRDVAANSSPDGLAFLFVAINTALFLKDRTLALIYLLPLNCVIRTDLILFNALLLSSLFLRRPELRIHVVASSVMSVTAYLGVSHYFENEGWANVFTNTFIRRDLHPEGVDYAITPTQYLHALASGVRWGLSQQREPWIFLLAGTSFAYLASTGRLRTGSDQLEKLTHLVGWSVAYTVLHFLLFPGLYTRFFIAQYVTTLACCFAAVGRIGPGADVLAGEYPATSMEAECES